MTGARFVNNKGVINYDEQLSLLDTFNTSKIGHVKGALHKQRNELEKLCNESGIDPVLVIGLLANSFEGLLNETPGLFNDSSSLNVNLNDLIKDFDKTEHEKLQLLYSISVYLYGSEKGTTFFMQSVSGAKEKTADSVADVYTLRANDYFQDNLSSLSDAKNNSDYKVLLNLDHSFVSKAYYDIVGDVKSIKPMIIPVAEEPNTTLDTTSNTPFGTTSDITSDVTPVTTSDNQFPPLRKINPVTANDDGYPILNHKDVGFVKLSTGINLDQNEIWNLYENVNANDWNFYYNGHFETATRDAVEYLFERFGADSFDVESSSYQREYNELIISTASYFYVHGKEQAISDLNELHGEGKALANQIKLRSQELGSNSDVVCKYMLHAFDSFEHRIDELPYTIHSESTVSGTLDLLAQTNNPYSLETISTGFSLVDGLDRVQMFGDPEYVNMNGQIRSDYSAPREVNVNLGENGEISIVLNDKTVLDLDDLHHNISNYGEKWMDYFLEGLYLLSEVGVLDENKKTINNPFKDIFEPVESSDKFETKDGQLVDYQRYKVKDYALYEKVFGDVSSQSKMAIGVATLGASAFRVVYSQWVNEGSVGNWYDNIGSKNYEENKLLGKGSDFEKYANNKKGYSYARHKSAFTTALAFTSELYSAFDNVDGSWQSVQTDLAKEAMSLADYEPLTPSMISKLLEDQSFGSSLNPVIDVLSDHLQDKDLIKDAIIYDAKAKYLGKLTPLYAKYYTSVDGSELDMRDLINYVDDNKGKSLEDYGIKINTSALRNDLVLAYLNPIISSENKKDILKIQDENVIKNVNPLIFTSLVFSGSTIEGDYPKSKQSEYASHYESSNQGFTLDYDVSILADSQFVNVTGLNSMVEMLPNNDVVFKAIKVKTENKIIGKDEYETLRLIYDGVNITYNLSAQMFLTRKFSLDGKIFNDSDTTPNVSCAEIHLKLYRIDPETGVETLHGEMGTVEIPDYDSSNPNYKVPYTYDLAAIKETGIFVLKGIADKSNIEGIEVREVELGRVTIKEEIIDTESKEGSNANEVFDVHNKVEIPSTIPITVSKSSTYREPNGAFSDGFANTMYGEYDPVAMRYADLTPEMEREIIDLRNEIFASNPELAAGLGFEIADYDFPIHQATLDSYYLFSIFNDGDSRFRDWSRRLVGLIDGMNPVADNDELFESLVDSLSNPDTSGLTATNMFGPYSIYLHAETIAEVDADPNFSEVKLKDAWETLSPENENASLIILRTTPSGLSYGFKIKYGEHLLSKTAEVTFPESEGELGVGEVTISRELAFSLDRLELFPYIDNLFIQGLGVSAQINLDLKTESTDLEIDANNANIGAPRKKFGVSQFSLKYDMPIEVWETLVGDNLISRHIGSPSMYTSLQGETEFNTYNLSSLIVGGKISVYLVNRNALKLGVSYAGARNLHLLKLKNPEQLKQFNDKNAASDEVKFDQLSVFLFVEPTFMDYIEGSIKKTHDGKINIGVKGGMSIPVGDEEIVATFGGETRDYQTPGRSRRINYFFKFELIPLIKRIFTGKENTYSKVLSDQISQFERSIESSGGIVDRIDKINNYQINSAKLIENAKIFYMSGDCELDDLKQLYNDLWDMSIQIPMTSLDRLKIDSQFTELENFIISKGKP